MVSFLKSHKNGDFFSIKKRKWRKKWHHYDLSAIPKSLKKGERRQNLCTEKQKDIKMAKKVVSIFSIQYVSIQNSLFGEKNGIIFTELVSNMMKKKK